MKVLSNLLLLLLFIGSAFSLNYYASEMASVETVRVLYDEHLSDNALTEGNVYLIADNGSDLVWTQVSCCLLYTSPSPRDQRGSRMPSSA